MIATMTGPSRKNGRTDPDQIEIDLEFGLPKIRSTISVKETADYLGCDIAHVYRLVDQGDLTGENIALKTEGLTPKGKARQRYIRIHRDSAIAFRRRRRIEQ